MLLSRAFVSHRASGVVWQPIVLGAALVISIGIACCVYARRRGRNKGDPPPDGRTVASRAQVRSGSINPSAKETMRPTSDSEFSLSPLPGRRLDHDAERRIPNPVLHPPASGPPPTYKGSQPKGSQPEARV
ncbi:hypothetical protein GSI_01609 [Ganoderma sinense ZZ0214-1]|uniref:Uncharacterized protein n=1 Tax=Ganoderma sinense ZZ0214-1 TaxID=1077348 RepID=A0A2G8SQ98_9APHY|nr:hypothetical protein GSI_01609 [Ganoderma sinense ZZ0214-1]